MMKNRWIILGTAFLMMAATAGFLEKVRSGHKLGAPGVRVGAVPIYNSNGKLVSRQSVLLPVEVGGAHSQALPITVVEVAGLPRDTTFGRRAYSLADNFDVLISVVLMGSDRTSIHQPQFCLVGQGWSIDQTDYISVPLKRPFNYNLPAVKLTTSLRVSNPRAPGQAMTVHGIYVYWFVSGENITSQQGSRMWSIARTMIEKGVLERWAYITYFATCLPGQEDATFERLEKFIQVSAPDFQVVTGQPSGKLLPMTALLNNSQAIIP